MDYQHPRTRDDPDYYNDPAYDDEYQRPIPKQAWAPLAPPAVAAPPQSQKHSYLYPRPAPDQEDDFDEFE